MSLVMKKSEYQELVQKYTKQSAHYFRNALKFIQNNETEKAGEFLWGSVAEIMKAAAASKGIELKTHAELWNYAQALAKELEDNAVYDTFSKANALHSNFYEIRLPPQEILVKMEEVKKLLSKMLDLLGLKDIIVKENETNIKQPKTNN